MLVYEEKKKWDGWFWKWDGWDGWFLKMGRMRWMIYGITHLQETTEKLRETPRKPPRNSEKLPGKSRETPEKLPRNYQLTPRKLPRNYQLTPEKLSTTLSTTLSTPLHYHYHTFTLSLLRLSTREIPQVLERSKVLMVSAPIPAILFSLADVE